MLLTTRIRLATAAKLSLALCCVWLTACPSLGPRADLPPTLEHAEQLTRQGDHAAAAREFEGLAELATLANDAVVLRQRAVQQWLAARRAGDAARVLTQIPATNNPQLDTERALLAIELQLAQDQAATAWTSLTTLAIPTDTTSRSHYWRLRQQISLALGRANEAIAAQATLEADLPDNAQRSVARRQLLQELTALSLRGGRLEPASAGKDTVVRGWLEIGLIATEAERGRGIGPALANWRARYASHPAAELANSDLVAKPLAPLGTAPGQHVAVLLPLTGRGAAQAAQIRDGILTSWFNTPANDRAELRFYDTGSMNVVDALAAAQSAGADFIVGPLLREEVLAAADFTASRAPTLALNFLPSDRPAPGAFIQFALSPEDEARLVARRALADGHRRAVALLPGSDWGQRVLAAFTEELTSGGGTVLASSSYTAGSADHSAAITSLLRVNDSRARARRLEAIIGGSVNLQPRRRADIDFVFATGPAASARTLRPQLRFFYAGDIPAYATSDSHEPGSTNNGDMDGVMFPEMPWVLGGGEAVSRARNAARNAWGDAPNGRSKLFAFGYDAWSLANALRSTGGASMQNVDGLTGELSLGGNQRIRRELDWAQMRGGAARAL